jgi:hypothetical protein
MHLIDRFAVWWCFRRKIGMVSSITLHPDGTTAYYVEVARPKKRAQIGDVVRFIREEKA